MNLKELARKAVSTLFLSMLCLVAFAQTATGLVKDKTGEPMIGVNVLVKGTTNGTITDINGKFTLTNISPTNKTIIVSFIGMETQEVTIKPEMKIVMTSTTEVMEEVLVVAYGTAKKSAFTGSAKMIHTEQITKRPVTNVEYSQAASTKDRAGRRATNDNDKWAAWRNSKHSDTWHQFNERKNRSPHRIRRYAIRRRME